MQLLQELRALLQLPPYIFRLKRDKDDIIAFLPVLEKLVIQATPFHVKHTRSDELAVKGRTHSGMFSNDSRRSSKTAQTA